MRKIITTQAHYTPVTWGIMDREGEITAYIKFVRTDADTSYIVYGDDADVYKEFEEDGFTKTKTVSSYAEGYRWLKENAEDSLEADYD